METEQRYILIDVCVSQGSSNHPPFLALSVTQVFDFLFLVGQLEEKGHGGDSAETALLACGEKVDEVRSFDCYS